MQGPRGRTQTGEPGFRCDHHLKNSPSPQISTWKIELLTNGSQVFEKPGKSAGPDPQTREDELLRIIGHCR